VRRNNTNLGRFSSVLYGFSKCTELGAACSVTRVYSILPRWGINECFEAKALKMISRQYRIFRNSRRDYLCAHLKKSNFRFFYQHNFHVFTFYSHVAQSEGLRRRSLHLIKFSAEEYRFCKQQSNQDRRIFLSSAVRKIRKVFEEWLQMR
jgi:hypothetical protein